MKTLKQIREEYDGHFTSQVDNLPDSMMLEEKGLVKTIPSSKEMPSLLIFRRISYRLYPNKQVVALYYSKLLNKYLSIPFGPDGNLNLSESVVLDESELDEGIIGDTIEKGRQWAQDKVKDSQAFKTAQEIGHHLPGYGNVKAAKEKWTKGDKWGAAKEAGKSLAKAAGTGVAVAGALAGGKELLKKALGSGGGDDSKDSSGDRQVVSVPSRITSDRPSPKAKHYSSWETATGKDPVYQSKLRQASLKENKIADIRNMVNEGIETSTLHINGRQVTLNTSMAKRILEVYDSVNTKNKKIVESMLNEDLESFKKLLNFSIKA